MLESLGNLRQRSSSQLTSHSRTTQGGERWQAQFLLALSVLLDEHAWRFAFAFPEARLACVLDEVVGSLLAIEIHQTIARLQLRLRRQSRNSRPRDRFSMTVSVHQKRNSVGILRELLVAIRAGEHDHRVEQHRR